VAADFAPWKPDQPPINGYAIRRLPFAIARPLE
jgi:hypothetical protein